jgi:DNA primase
MIPQETIQRVLDAANIEQVVSEFVSLKKKGVNYLGVCPFHNEKTPSLVVSPAKGIYKCFGCGKSGNAIGFVMEHEKLTYPEAVRYVADKFKVDVPTVEPTPEEKQKSDKREVLFAVNRIAATFFANNLKDDPSAQAYIKSRDFDQTDIDAFELGSVGSNWDDLLKHFAKLGFKPETLYDAGLLSKSDRSRNEFGMTKEKYFDRFRERVMFPFYDRMGHVVGFTGRIIDGPSTSSGTGAGFTEQGEVAKQVRDDYKPAKYLNSPETEVFRKGKLLYGLRQAQTEIVRKGRVNLVEGTLDVIRFHKQGLKNTVCTSGTALTEDHARIIRRFTDNVVLILDGDSAGAKATLRMVEIFLEQGLNVYAALMPQGEDPDTFAKGKSTEEIERWIEENEKDFVMLKIALAAKNIDERPAERGKLINELLELVNKIPDAVTREEYRKEVEGQFQVNSEKGKGKSKGTGEGGSTSPSTSSGQRSGDGELFGLMANELVIREKDELTIYPTMDGYMNALGTTLNIAAIVFDGVMTAAQIGKLGDITKNLVFRKGLSYSPDTEKSKKFIEHLKFLAESGFKVTVNCPTIGEEVDTKLIPFFTYYIDMLSANIEETSPDTKTEAVESAAEFLSKQDATTIAIETTKVAKKFGLSKADFSSVLKPFMAKVKNKVQQRNEQIQIDDERYVFSIENLPSYVNQTFFNKYKHFAAENKDGKKIFYVFATEHGTLTKIANFYMEPQFQVYSDDPLKNKRVVKLNHADLRTSRFVEIPSNEMIEFGAFKKFLFRQGPYMLTNAKVFHLEMILDSIALEFPVAYELTIFGQQQEDFYAFSNAVFSEGKIQYMNDLGLIEHDGMTYYSPSVSVIYKDARKDDDQFALDRFFIYRDTNNVTFKDWAALVKEVYKYNDNGYWCIMLACMCAFRSDIFKIDRLFTTLFFIGPTECGKSQLAQSIRALYVHPDAPMFNLNSGTDAAFFTMLQRYRDAPVVMEEYNDQQISDIKFQGLKAAVYDGEGKTKRTDAKSTGLDVSQVNAIPLLLGQEAPERDDASLGNRCVLCHVPKRDEWTDDEIANFQLLKRWEKDGLTGLLVQLLKYRPVVRDHYQRILRTVQKELRKDLNESGSVFQTRVLNTVSLFLAMVRLMKEHAPDLELPFTYDEFYKVAKQKLVTQSESITSSNRLAVFWDTFVLLTEDQRNGLLRGREYKIETVDELTIREGQKNSKRVVFDDGPKKVLFVRLEIIHPKYRDKVGIQEHLKMNNLQTYLKDHPAYIGAVKQTTFTWKTEQRSAAKDDNGVVIPGRVVSNMVEEFKRTSAIAFDYDKLGFELSEVEEVFSLQSQSPVVVGRDQGGLFDQKDGDGLPY